MRTSKNSSDMERGPGPRSIAVEFSEVRMAVQKLQRGENTTFHFHAAPFGTRSPRCERDVRRHSSSSLADALQASQMALVVDFNSVIGGDLWRTNSPASLPAWTIGDSTTQHVGRGTAACRRGARERRRHDAVGHGDGMRLAVAPMHAAYAACVHSGCKCA